MPSETLGERVIVYPPPPRNPTNVISPSQIAINLEPSGAGISIPVWLVAAPDVGAVLFPKYELIFVYPGIGHWYSPQFMSNNISGFFSKLLWLIVGMKKIHINIVKMIIDKINFLILGTSRNKNFIKLRYKFYKYDISKLL